MTDEVYKTEAEYEAMTVEQLTESYNDFEIRKILQRVFGLDSVVYFIDKDQKLRYITQPDQRPDVLAEGEEKRSVHRENNRTNRVRPKGTVAERMEEETKDRRYRLVSIDRVESAEDALTGKAIRVAYTIEDIADGSQFVVSRGTCRWLEDKGRLEGFVVSKGRKTAAHAAGAVSAADLLAANGNDKVTKPEVVEEATDDGGVADDEEEEETATGSVESAEVESDEDKELEDLLDSLGD